MKQHQTSKDSFARSLIGLSIGIVVLLGGVMFLFQSFYITSDSTLSPTTPKLETTTTSKFSEEPSTVHASQASTVVPPVLLSLADKKVISVNDTITMPAPAHPRATMAADVEPANTSTTIESTSAASQAPATPIDKTVAESQPSAAPIGKTAADEAPSSKAPVVTANKTSTKANETSEDKDKKDKVALTSTHAETEKTGWIYAGQFSDGKWQAKGLIIGDELPAIGHSYALNWGANIRANPPGKANTDRLSENVGYLAQGRKVDIVQLKQSGSKGHIWVQIKR
jgi:hypothetical protein